ncbi:hypothetical protein MANES_03G195500v8 [Manihot esculenta]|uniref:Uncharacterized protein n=1 Tax=Manihot esculenta TaxID=3983 RepID=A0ACB7I6W5_MANES|nr:hypothetical protein MANES_03G195500v8 [Manihot esculenta]
MASMPHVSLSKVQGSPSLSTSLLLPAASLPIRAPITPDDDSLDYESADYIDHAYSDTDTSSSIDHGSEEYVSCEEFESASEKFFAGDPDDEKPEESRILDKYQLSKPFVPNPDEESSGNSTVNEQESGVTNEHSHAVGSYSPDLQHNMPVAQLSMDEDDFEELISNEGDGRFSAIFIAPRVKVPAAEEDKDELLLRRDPYVVNKIELLPVEDNDDLLSGNSVRAADHSVPRCEDGKFAGKASPNGFVSVALTEDDSDVVTLEAQVEMENKENSEMKEKVKHVVDDLVSIELRKDGGQVVVPKASIEFSMESKDDAFLSQTGGDARQFVEERLQLDNLEQEKIERIGIDGHNRKSLENDFMDHVYEPCGASQLKEQIAEVINGCGDSCESEMNQVHNILPHIGELKGDGTILLKQQMSEIVNSFNHTFIDVINPDDESIQKIVPEPQEMKVEVVGVEEENAIDFMKGDKGRVFNGSLALEKGSEDASLVEYVDNAFEVNEIQTEDLLGDSDLPEICGGDRLEEASQGDTISLGIRDEANHDSEEVGGQKGLLSEGVEELIFEGTGNIENILSKLEKSSTSSPSPIADDFHDHQETVDGQIILDPDEKLETDKEHETKVFDSATLTLLKAATGAELDGDSTTETLVDSGVVSVGRPAGSGSSFDTISRASQSGMIKDVVNNDTGKEEKKMIEKIQHIRVKYLRLVQRLGHSLEDSIVTHVLHRLVLASGLHVHQESNLEDSKKMAAQLEAEGKDDLDFCLNILVIGKTGVGKSATINSIFGEKKAMVNAFESGTTRVGEIVGIIDGVRFRILDTPGLRSSMKEEATNRRILASIKKITKKYPPDVVLYVDRLDAHTRDLDLSLLASLTNSLTASVWRNAIVILTHAAATPPDGPFGSPLSFEVFVAQRSHSVQLAISQAVGDLRLMHPSMMRPVCLAENHPSCERNKEGQSILPNGQSWRPQLLLLCYSLKILSKSRPHPKLAAEQGGDDVDSDVELIDLSDSDGENEYDRLPPFKPLKKSQVNKLSRKQKKAYFDEYDYRVKLLQKKQWREEVKRLKVLKKKSKDSRREDVDQEDASPATVPVPMPEFVLPHSFDSDNPSYRYRMLEPAPQLLVRPVLDSKGWDHDCGYDGVSLEGNLALAGQFPGAFTVQITKDKKDFNIHLDSSISAKHGENGSTMAGFDIQTIGSQLGYILRSETKFKNFKINKTSAGISITKLSKNVATGLKIEDQIGIGKLLALVGNAGAVRSGGDTAYGANLEVHLKSKEFPVEQDESTLGLSLMKWRGDLGVMANLQSQFSIGRNSKMAINVGMNNRQSGQITIKTSSSELQIALISMIPMAISLLKSIYPGLQGQRELRRSVRIMVMSM